MERNSGIVIDEHISLRLLESDDAQCIFAILDGFRERMRICLPFVDYTLSPDDSAQFVEAVTRSGEEFSP